MSETPKWYVVHTYSGYENKVATDIENAVENRKLHDLIAGVMVPTEKVVEIKDNKKREVERKIFPGYVLVNMIMTDDSWYVVRNTTGVTGFVGTGAKPVPLYEDEVRALLKQMGMEEARKNIDCAVGDTVELLTESFKGQVGQVSEIDAEKGKITVMVPFFGGRETPVEVEFDQVLKV